MPGMPAWRTWASRRTWADEALALRQRRASAGAEGRRTRTPAARRWQSLRMPFGASVTAGAWQHGTTQGSAVQAGLAVRAEFCTKTRGAAVRARESAQGDDSQCLQLGPPRVLPESPCRGGANAEREPAAWTRAALFSRRRSRLHTQRPLLQHTSPLC